MSASKLLNDTEAAFKLGITKELLYAYLRNAPKIHLGHTRKLESIVKEGKNYFDEKELIRFDDYLKEPWSEKNSKRPEIPKYIQDYLRAEIDGQCPISGKGYPLDNAHIIDYSESLNHHHHNLIRIAKDEHAKADNGIIPKSELRKIKDILIQKLRAKLNSENNYIKTSFHPPLPNALFIGRFEILHELTIVMETERFIVIEGLGGIGKTQLLLHALNSFEYHNPVIWIDIENINNISDFHVIFNNAVSPYVANNTQALVTDLLRDIQITIIFDSFEKIIIADRDKVEDFLNLLITQNESVQVIITSQVDLSIFGQQKTIIKLEGLNEKDSRLLFDELLRSEANNYQTSYPWFIDFCNGHPLSIKLLSSLLIFYKSAERVIQALEKNIGLNQPLRKKLDKSTSLNCCLSTIYDCLDDTKKNILHYLKYYPAGMKYRWAENHFKVDDFNTSVADLQQFFFVELKIDSLNFERINIPNPIKPFLTEKINQNGKDEDDPIRKDAITNIMIEASIIDLHYIEASKDGNLAYGVRRMEEEVPNLLNANNIAQKLSIYYSAKKEIQLKNEYLRIVSEIAGALGTFCFTRGYYSYGIMFSNAGIKANVDLNEPSLAADQYMYLIQIQLRQFDLKGVTKTITDLTNLAKTTGEISAKIYSVWANGSLEFEKNNYELARSLYTKAIEHLKIAEKRKKQKDDSHFKDFFDKYSLAEVKGNIAILKFEIAKTFEFSGQYEDAIKIHRKAIKSMTLLGNRLNLMSNFNHLAFCLMKSGFKKDGLIYYRKSIIGFYETGQVEYLANSISDLGRFVEQWPDIAKNKILQEQFIIAALESLSYQIKDFIKRSEIEKDLNTRLQKIPYQIIGKSILIIQVIGLSKHKFCLTEWAIDLIADLKIQMDKQALFVHILNLAHNVGGIDYWVKEKEKKDHVVKSILQSCLIINGGSDLKSQTRIFYWLTLWMKDNLLDKEASAEKLFSTAWDSLD